LSPQAFHSDECNELPIDNNFTNAAQIGKTPESIGQTDLGLPPFRQIHPVLLALRGNNPIFYSGMECDQIGKWRLQPGGAPCQIQISRITRMTAEDVDRTEFTGERSVSTGGDSRGTNQLAMRLANERLILALIRRHPGLAKAEIARLTGLTPQATTIIVNRLEADGLLTRRTPQRGKVGQPAIPYSLASNGAFAMGLLVGRRSCDVIMMDFLAGIRQRARLHYAYPLPGAILDFVAESRDAFVAGLEPGLRDRVAGIGVATPFELWHWESHLHAPAGSMAVWRETDLKAELQKRLDMPVALCNDATAACGAELTFGGSQHHTDFLYVFINTFVGGGLVLGGKVFFGRTGNAGAIGSLPVPDLRRLKVNQLIDWASLQRLEDNLRAAGQPTAAIQTADGDWMSVEPEVNAWIEEIAPNLALAAVSAAAFVEIEAIVIDGVFPAWVRDRICKTVAEHIRDLDQQGITHFEVAAGSLGADAPVIGGGALHFLDFSRDAL
jgi:predicted NBD/HSP70 family sugar kinase